MELPGSYRAGPKIKVILNGTVILDADITDSLKYGAADGLDHPGLLGDSSHIGFLGHGSHLSSEISGLKI